MAALLRDKLSKSYKVKFWYGGKQYKWSLRHSNKTLANETLATVERTLRDLEEGRLVVPDGADVVEFVKTDGGRTAKLAAPEKPLTIGDLFKLYPEKVTPGSKKGNSLGTNKTHGRHLVRILGTERSLPSMTAPGSVQEYVDKRATEKRGKKKRSPKARTIKKEVATLGMTWRWAYNTGLTKTAFPEEQVGKLVYPKEREKPPFQTWDDIKRKVERGGLTKEEQKEMWDCLFLDMTQVQAVLDFVKKKHINDWLYYAILFVAHTGARRSEMLRSQVEDFDWKQGILHIREYKRKKGKLSYREVPMSPKLMEEFKAYFNGNHSGQFSIAVCPEAAEEVVAERGTEGYVTWVGKRVSDAFRDVFEGSEWAVLHGYHTFRHSIISNMARESIDQRLIDGIVGHETEAMRQRYRHLFPSDKQAVIRKLFGDNQATTDSVSQS